MKKSITLLLFFGCICRIAAQVDTVPPVLACKQNLSINLGPNCYTELLPIDLVDFTATDLENNTVQLGIRRRCAGIGFPENIGKIIYTTCDQGGGNFAELWARDQAGNVSNCQLEILVHDNAGNCDPAFRMTTNLPTGIGIVNTKVVVEANNSCFIDSISIEFLTYSFSNWSPDLSAGNAQYSCFFAPPGYTTTVTASKSGNYNNGVTPFDLVLISRHILGISLLDSPYKIIAADANLDNKVDMDDVILLKKWILDATGPLAKGLSWRYVPKDFVFPDPSHPFATPLPEKIVVPNTALWGGPTDFIGVKIGDVNYTADPAN